jgi:UDP-glucose 4-epimerase
MIYRLANIVVPTSRLDVIYDFIQKLKRNPKEQVEILNIGSEDQVDVKTIAQIVIQEMRLKGVKLVFTGGVDDGRGWKGDVKNMLLDITRLKRLGWKPRLNSKQAVRETVKSLKRNTALD